MAANRKKSGGGQKRNGGHGGTGLRAMSYLGAAALGAVLALAATGRLAGAPDALMAQVRAFSGQVAPEKPRQKRAAKAPERGRTGPQAPDRSIETSAVPVPRPQRDVANAHPDVVAAVARPPVDVTPGAAAKTGPDRTTRLTGLTFPICGEGPSRNCVIDGDTFVVAGKAFRVADVDTPETGNPKCRQEAELARRATQRLKDLLNAGPLDLVAVDRDQDVYGRKLRTVMRDGRSLGETLIAEGLARRWTGTKSSWCA
jgi:endonuclease YncB( thermonuclease family)